MQVPGMFSLASYMLYACFQSLIEQGFVSTVASLHMQSTESQAVRQQLLYGCT